MNTKSVIILIQSGIREDVILADFETTSAAEEVRKKCEDLHDGNQYFVVIHPVFTSR